MDNAEKLVKIINNFESFAKNFLTISTKSGEKVKFTLNRAQKYTLMKIEQHLKMTGKVRVIILKGRQLGISTLIEGRFFWKVITHHGLHAYILTHEAEATKNLFNMALRFQKNLPRGLCPEPDKSSSKELIYSKFDSGYSVGTAGNKGAGRSQTIQLFHGSEVAFWPHADEHAKGVMEAVPNEPGTEMILESTANGIGNEFHSKWQAAHEPHSEYIPIFTPWYWDDKYKASIEGIVFTDEEKELYEMHNPNGLTGAHLAWRRLKIAGTKDVKTGRLRFKQEYPFTAQEAFLNPVEMVFFDAEIVYRAMKFTIHNANGRLKIGVDPARSGMDGTAIVRRIQRKVYNIEKHYNMNTMEVVGRLVRIIKDEAPYKMYIDCIGIGAGIVDRLCEMGYGMIIVAVNNAETARERDRFTNRRAENWGLMREWFDDDMGVDIPDDDELHAELCAISYKYDSNDRLLLESKEKMKSRGLSSPDKADALANTFDDGIHEIQTPTQRRMKRDQDRGRENYFR